jgi:adenylate cyclase
MAAARVVTTYEVHVMQESRWEIHARHALSAKEEALEEARNLNNLPSVEAVRVVKETYDASSGVGEELLIYQSSERQQQESAAARASRVVAAAKMAPRPVPGRRPAQAQQVEEKLPPKPKPATIINVFLGIISSGIMSLCIAAMVALAIGFVLRNSASLGISVGESARTQLFAISFILTFILSVVPMVRSSLRKLDMRGFGRSRRKAPPPRPVVVERLPEPEEAPPEPEKEEEPEEEEKEVVEEMVALDPHAEKQRLFIMTFLGEELKPLKEVLPKMDNFNKFGFNLFMAGATEVLSQDRHLDADASAAILAGCIELMGFKKDQAASFAERYKSYLMSDPRYMKMFEAGRGAMKPFLGGDMSEANHLEQALATWNKPVAEDEAAGPITVMFTDMVGSTALTQDRGDAIAQQVVHAHNRVVRHALTRHSGREIKHTGDGIMASFAATSNAVEASILIQRNVAAHNKLTPDLPLHLKIGINAGEPIAEDDDLFGTVVQLSARIVDKAQSEQIFVSEIVHAMCAGKDLRFFNRGAYYMKGFAEDVSLYEVAWDETAAPPPEEAASTPQEATPAPDPTQQPPAPQPGAATVQPQADASATPEQGMAAQQPAAPAAEPQQAPAQPAPPPEPKPD